MPDFRSWQVGLTLAMIPATIEEFLAMVTIVACIALAAALFATSVHDVRGWGILAPAAPVFESHSQGLRPSFDCRYSNLVSHLRLA